MGLQVHFLLELILDCPNRRRCRVNLHSSLHLFFFQNIYTYVLYLDSEYVHF